MKSGTTPELERRAHERRHHQLLALVAATLIHAALFAILFLIPPTDAVQPNKGADTPSPGQDEGAISVALVRPPSSAFHAPSTAEALEMLRRRLVAETPDAIATAPRPIQRHAWLLDMFGPDAPDPKPDKTAEAQASPAGSPNGAAPKVIDPMALASLPSALRAEPNLLWPQVARCWRPPQGKSDVIMVVQLDPHGQIDGAPIIYRVGAGGALSEAEQEAVRAVRSCAPYHMPAGAATSYNLRFGSAGTG